MCETRCWGYNGDFLLGVKSCPLTVIVVALWGGLGLFIDEQICSLSDINTCVESFSTVLYFNTGFGKAGLEEEVCWDVVSLLADDHTPVLRSFAALLALISISHSLHYLYKQQDTRHYVSFIQQTRDPNSHGGDTQLQTCIPESPRSGQHSFMLIIF